MKASLIMSVQHALTKKDFERIAATLADSRGAALGLFGETPAAIRANFERCHASTVRDIAKTLMKTNPKFDAERFTALAGVQHV